MDQEPTTGEIDPREQTAAEAMLRSLAEYGVEYIFANFGTDHTPILEAASKIRASDGQMPEFVLCPHESGALSAAHGYAAVTGNPQAVFVHVDVGTQNLGAMVHNAHRGNAPVLIFAGLSPVSHEDGPGARSNSVHYLQDVYNQSDIVDQYCRWTQEYRPPADPDELVARGLKLASTPRQGPTYLTATREALEHPTDTKPGSRSVNAVRPAAADNAAIERIATRIEEANVPLVITSKLGTTDPEQSVNALVSFAETAGAGVVEQTPAALCFPRDHYLHAGFRPQPAIESADLVLLVDTDIPWTPSEDAPRDLDIPVVQIDVDPEKNHYPRWDFQIDDAVRADPGQTLSALTNRIDTATGETGREEWRTRNSRRRGRFTDELQADYREDKLTPAVLSDAINNVIDESTIIVNEAATSLRTALRRIPVTEPGSYFGSHGSGLGWGPGAAVGAKLAAPDQTVITLVGDGSYVFSNPTATAWTSDAYDAPTLTIVYNNSGWNAVRSSTLAAHPEGAAADADVPESDFTPAFDLSHAAHVANAHTDVIESIEELAGSLSAALAAVESGTSAVLDVRVEQPE